MPAKYHRMVQELEYAKNAHLNFMYLVRELWRADAFDYSILNMNLLRQNDNADSLVGILLPEER